MAKKLCSVSLSVVPLVLVPTFIVINLPIDWCIAKKIGGQSYMGFVLYCKLVYSSRFDYGLKFSRLTTDF
jgi:hypothetical protein